MMGIRYIKTFYTSAVMGMYQPFLTSLSFGVISYFFGVESATPFHVFSFIFHLFNLILVYSIGLKIFDHN